MEGLEYICFQMISCNGSARSFYIEALQKAKEGLFEEAKSLIEEGDTMFTEGHRVHMELIQQEAGGNSTEVKLLLIHAEDQMMSAEVIRILAVEMIELYEKLNRSVA